MARPHPRSLLSAALDSSIEAAQAGKDHLRVQSGVGPVQTRIRQVEPAILERERQVLAQEVVGAHTSLEIELEPLAQVATGDVGVGNPTAAFREGHPAASGREVVSQQRDQPDEHSAPAVRLLATPELAEQLEMA